MKKRKDEYSLNWDKKGVVLRPCNDTDWMSTHTSVPTLLQISENQYRIFFAGRSKENYSRLGYLDIDLNNPMMPIYLTPRPIMDVGSLGAFDDSGVTPAWAICVKNEIHLYYTGWMRGQSIPYYLSIGLAVSSDGGESFQRYSKAPILSRNSIDPYLTASPCVILDEGIFKMWYVSGTKWGQYNNTVRPNYNIKYAESHNGVNWDRFGDVCIDFKYKDEWAISRPSVIKENELYKMWYSYSCNGYRLGYAESYDGIKWVRKDEEVGINLSANGWDSKMMAYPSVIKNNDQLYLFYNGNGYGQTGMGYAIKSEQR